MSSSDKFVVIFFESVSNDKIKIRKYGNAIYKYSKKQKDVYPGGLTKSEALTKKNDEASPYPSVYKPKK